MRSHPYSHCLVWVALSLATPLTALAQSTVMVQISGVVSDPVGSAVPGAVVKGIQTATGFVRTATTGGDGRYILSSLPVGPYRIEVTGEGFKTYVQRGIVLEVSTNPVINVRLELGSVSQSIDVTANASMTETQETSISQVINQQRILELPLNGREATELVLLSGMSTPQGTVPNKVYPSSQLISVAGGQAHGTQYVLDGGDHNDAFGGLNLPMPFPDALQEFSIQTSTMSAKYGVVSGAVVNTVTKSGTNEFHGSAFEFLRTGAANARNFFAADRDHLQRNQFGGVLGGPIVKSKLLFFGGYQGTRVTTAPPTTRDYVPNAAMLAGDFSSRMSRACGQARTLKDPTTGQPFPNSFIPPSRFSPQAQNLMRYLPTTENPCGEVMFGIPDDSREDQVIGRIDWIRSERHYLLGRYYITDNAEPAVFDGKNLLFTQRAGMLVRVQSWTFGDNYTLDPHSINSIHFTWTRGWLDRGPAPNVISSGDIGLKVAPSEGNPPAISVTGGFSTSCGTCARAYVHNYTYQFADDVSLIRGRHQIGLGVNWIHRSSNYKTTTQEDSSFTFNGQFTNDGLADFLLGVPSVFQQGNQTITDQGRNSWGLYAQDDVRLTSRLSVNSGIRWEPFLPVYEMQNRRTHFDLEAYQRGDRTQMFKDAPAGFLFPGDPGMPRAGTNRRLMEFAPRSGIVWDAMGNGRLTVRSSYGILFDQTDIQYSDRFAFGSPWASLIQIDSPRGGFGDPYVDYPGGNPFPMPTPPPANVVFPLGAQFVNLPLDVRQTYQQQWNISVQKQLGANWMISATYIGNKSTHRWVQRQLNPAIYIPGTCGKSPCSTLSNIQDRRVLSLIRPADGAKVSSLVQADDGGNANYNGMLLTANHRFSNNFNFMANYTWSHCISDQEFSNELGGSYMDPTNRRRDRGNCDSDRRQIFNSSLVVVSPHFASRAVQRLLGNWQASAIIGWTTGSWISPNSGRDNDLNGLGDRPDVVGDLPLPHRSINQWFNTAAFTANATGVLGNAGRNIIEGPSAFHWDSALMRRFVPREGHQLEARIEAFNVLNHVRFGNPNTNIRVANYGMILSAGAPRIMQFALKYYF